MPRWAEIVILLVVACMAVIAILVFARVRHRESEELQRQTDLTLAQSQTIPDLPRDLLDIGPVAPRRTPPPQPAAEFADRVVLPPVTRPVASTDVGAVDAATVDSGAGAAQEERPFVLTDIVTTPDDDAAPASDATEDVTEDIGDTSDDLADVTTADTGAKAIVSREAGVVEAGSAAELAVLRDAERTLNALYAYRLRADIPKVLVQAEADRLTALLGRLPESTRVAVEAALEDGYRRLARDGNGPLVATPGAAGSKAMGLSDAEIGRGAPDDLRSFADRIRAIERGAGAPQPPPTGLPPSPSVGNLPAAPSGSVISPPTPVGAPSPSTAPAPSSPFPAAAPTPLDGRLD